MPMTGEIVALLFLSGLCAGFVDSIAGGGGLITLPVLLFVGLPPQLALGTNKLQGSLGTLSAAYNFIRKGQVQLKEAYKGIVFTLIGASVGAWTIQQLDPGFIRHLIPFLLLFVLVYILFAPKLGHTDGAAKLSVSLFFMLFGLGLGFYDGFFGPGTGSFWTAGFLILLGLNMTKAVGYTKIMNFTSNIVALAMFILGGNVLYSAGICMGLGQLIGARIGSNLAIEKGARFIRPIFLSVVTLTIIRLAYVNYTQ